MKRLFSSASLLGLTFALAAAQPTPAAAFSFTGPAGTNGTGQFPNGGHGGNVTVYPLSGDTSFDVTGGKGGDGVNGIYNNDVSGSGGDGGSVTAVDAFSKAGPLSLDVYIKGGNGGIGYGAGNYAGNGGLATAGLNVTSIDGSDLWLSVRQVGGKGGNGADDVSSGGSASAGSGSGSLLDNAVVGTTTGALGIYQAAYGGDGGGASKSAAGGAGGDATSILTLKDTSKASSLNLSAYTTGGSAGSANGIYGLVAKAGDAVSRISVEDSIANSVRLVLEARGGQGGSAGNGASPNAGGSALAEGSVKVRGTSGYIDKYITKYGVQIIENEILAVGGTAGETYSSLSGASHGGDAKALFVGSAYGTIAASVRAYGGEGGASNRGGNGGNGGYAEATGTIVVNDPLIDKANGKGSLLTVGATGGSGSSGFLYLSYGVYGSGLKSGNGSEAKISGSAIILGTDPDSTLQVHANQTGGNGGTAVAGGLGGDGANSFLDNPISVSTYGKLTYTQAATAGSGGSSDTAKGGDGGNAISRLVMDGSTASSLNITNAANGGAGGKSTSGQGGSGGYADAYTKVSSAIFGADVTVQSSAYGGGYPDSTKISPIKGAASATAIATGIGAKTPIRSQAQAQGSSGDVYSSSSLADLSGNKLTTVASAPISSSHRMGAGTSSTSGLSSWQGYYSGFAFYHAISFGNISLTASSPITSKTLKTAAGDFTEVADGKMIASNTESDAFAEVSRLSASYSFADLSVGNALLFSLTNADVVGTGLSSANFSLSESGSILYSHTFTSQSDWDAFFSAPLYLGKTSGATSLDLVLSNIILGEESSYSMTYKFVIASAATLSGTYTDVSRVPLPAAGPLFASALLGLGFWEKRRTSSRKRFRV